ncbi:MAG: indolepyruvate ferredoxin oxidoreductase family protein [Spongiibacteraceae bacterium]|nr:indolepyruvate ferredoxin oxidoreductase family protein [Spongiibacteraceae bacterium]
MKKPVITLDDKYTQAAGRVFMTSNQALVRLPLDQARRDRAMGLSTSGFISGYRGSPLGVFDSALWSAQTLLDEHKIVFQAGLNEELAISSIRGTQELDWFDKTDIDGVFGLWYGKGIGVDRACESMKLGNFEGSAAKGGFLIVAGDDHGGKSSDSAHQSEQTLMAAMVPILYPATISEIIEYGLFGWEMSRFSGCYVGLKTITDTLDLSGCVELPNPFRDYVTPTDVEIPPQGLNLHQNIPPLQEEEALVNYRLPAARAFARANGIDKVIIDGEKRSLSIVTAGKAYLDVRQAMADLALDENTCQQLGIRLYKPGLIWPMDKQTLTNFAEGSQAVLVVEEKRAVMEEQIARHLYALDANKRPALAGKEDLQGATLLSSIGELSVSNIRHALKKLLDQLNINDKKINTQFAYYSEIETHALGVGSNAVRPAYFCSGCPHNTSTNIPDGSLAMGGIGCHGLAAVVMDRNTMQFMPMGHEGSGWSGVSHFVDTPHIFQNMGDGTYSHSGLLAIRSAVANKTNITYKVLYNDAVAMTGGQPVELPISPIGMVKQLLSEGVKPVKLITDNPKRYTQLTLPPHCSLHHRDELDTIQKELRDSKGVSGIVYEQTCATEKRRRRKRGLMNDPDKRLFINPEVCEGCSDCSVQSNCISIQPLETELGRKRKVDQSTCNKDYSCAKGFCPSFVTVTGGNIAVRSSGDPERLNQLIKSLPTPQLAALDKRGYNILVSGIGGTGVLTIGALLGMAAHLDNKGCTILDLTGMAQKGGSVTSHIRIGHEAKNIYSSRLSEGMTDLLLACDMISGSGAAILKSVRPGHTAAIMNNDVAPTGEFQTNKYLDLGEARLRAAIIDAIDGGPAFDIHASKLATDLTGDSIGTNILMLGYAMQKGLLPLSIKSIQEAIHLNGSFVKGNLRTLALGRLVAHDPQSLAHELNEQTETVSLDTVDEVLNHRKHLLSNYQNAAYANRYGAFINDIRQRASAKLDDSDEFVRQVALTLSRLMTYKDEYEVARLYTDDQFMRRIREQFSGKFKISLNLAPPMLPGRDPSGRPKKYEFGSWMISVFKVLKRFKGLRGTAFDPFGYFPERRLERRLIKDYRELINKIVDQLDQANLNAAITLASAASHIAGYGLVKDAAVKKYEMQLPNLIKAVENPDVPILEPQTLKIHELSIK